MSLTAERAAFEGHFGTQWAATTPIKYENVPFDPPRPPVPWVGFFIRTDDAEQISLGENAVIRQYGLIIVQIFVPENSGTQVARSLANTAAGIFERQQIAVGSNTAVFQVPDIRVIGNFGGWFQINVTCPYSWCR